MNVEREYQQQQHTSMALMSSGEYVNFNAINTIGTASESTTAMTISMELPTPPLSDTLLSPCAAAAANATTTTSTTTAIDTGFETMGVMTSSFKTPLLPMPTLEDIEGVVYEQQQQQISHSMPLQQIQTATHLPVGILKYPITTAAVMVAATTTITTTTKNAVELNLPLSAVSSCMTSTVHSHDVLPTTTAPTATIGTLHHKYSAIKCTTNMKNRSSSSSSCATEIPISEGFNTGAGGNIISVGIDGGIVVPKTTTTTTAATNSIGAQNFRLRPNNSPTHVKMPTRSGGCCCACFRNAGKRKDDVHTKTRKSKNNAHTLWTAFITNVGISALLLAYTFLGAFIFLTIEGEDLYQQQRTLASTKRSGINGGRLYGSRDNVNNVAANVAHVYASQPHPAADNSTSSSAADSVTGTSALEGVVMAMNSNGETVYGWDTDSDDASTPQLALSAKTSDVRQRTIENIWDITVSLNILYKENWTKLAALEIAKFQDQLVKRLNEDAMLHYYAHDAAAGSGNRYSPATEAVLLHTNTHLQYEWNFAKAFFYALTVLTTIGYGHIAPRTTLSRLVTLVYAIFGIPLTLVYLSSTGGILAKVAREVFSKALCCCLCSNCGYCCYDEKRMAEKERRMKRKRQQEELRKQQANMQEPYYVRSGSGIDNFQLPEKQETNTPTLTGISDLDSLSVSESHGSMHGLSILAPILLCLSMMVIYIAFGALVLYRLENWPLIDGVYFCFMSLSTIGFGDMLPGLRRESNTTTWFCSIYIMSGMALTAMCFNVIHDEIVHRIKIVVEFKKTDLPLDTSPEQSNYYVPP